MYVVEPAPLLYPSWGQPRLGPVPWRGLCIREMLLLCVAYFHDSEQA